MQQNHIQQIDRPVIIKDISTNDVIVSEKDA